MSMFLDVSPIFEVFWKFVKILHTEKAKLIDIDNFGIIG